MGKVITYIIIAFTIAFALNYFGVVNIPLLDLPQKEKSGLGDEKDYNEHVNRGRDATRKAIEDMDKNSQ
ncbi:MAG: hypothetical protein AB7S75_21140 [Desulfococcaceae bacterium]